VTKSNRSEIEVLFKVIFKQPYKLLINLNLILIIKLINFLRMGGLIEGVNSVSLFILLYYILPVSK